MTDWAGAVAALAGRGVLVVGDVMLDEYIAGDARRVCPEAPVPVVEVERRWAVPGGAANAAANAVALGGRAVLVGVTGIDAAADGLKRVCAARGIDATGLVADADRPTTIKLRVLARGQQVIRADTESVRAIGGGVADQLVVACGAAAGAVLVSDYGKGAVAGGVVGRVIAAAGRRLVVVDPAGTDPARYRGAAVIKPNLPELAALTGMPVGTDEQALAAGVRLAEALPGTSVLLTRGAAGMALFAAGRPPRVLPAAHAKRVFDVTGAGDTAAATLTLAVAAGHPLELAARLANAAAGVVVGKVGTATASPAELLAALAAGVPDFASA